MTTQELPDSARLLCLLEVLKYEELIRIRRRFERFGHTELVDWMTELIKVREEEELSELTEKIK